MLSVVPVVVLADTLIGGLLSVAQLAGGLLSVLHVSMEMLIDPGPPLHRCAFNIRCMSD
jgi:hypothetical protein